MGTFYWPMEIGPEDGSRFETLNALVDSGATYSQVPRSWLLRLGIVPTATAESELADGSIIQDQIGDCKVRIDGRESNSIVLFGEEGSPALMGAYALGGVRLGIDPHNKRLVPVRILRPYRGYS